MPAPRHEGRYQGVQLPLNPAINETDVGDKPSYIQNLPSLNQAQYEHLTRLNQKRLEKPCCGG
ncbi:MAG: hypothetical protein R2880_11900 [Deinococcales bacterium]